MPLSNAERIQRYREKLKTDPERYNKYKEIERKRYHDSKVYGTVKLINVKTKRSQRRERRKWRFNKRIQRQKLKDVKKQLTPPASPVSDGPPDPPIAIPSCSRQKIQSNKKGNREKAKVYRDNHILGKKIENANRTIDRLKKRLERSTKIADTPRSKTRKLLRHFGHTLCNKVRKTLTFHYAVLQQLRVKYKESKQKRMIITAVIGSITGKYKLNKIIKRELRMRCNQRKPTRRCTISVKLKKEVHDFFERDDNSRMTTGIRQTVTRNKIKHQKRLMLDTLSNLYSKYQSEHNHVISFTTFFRLKPFWVKCPTEQDRQTCLCKTCENLGFMIRELYKNDVITTTCMDAIVEKVVCRTQDIDCMYGKCDACKEKQIKTNPFDQNRLVTYSEWVTEKETRELQRSGEVKDVSVTTKKETETTLGSLLDRVHNELWSKYRRHSYNIKNQFRHYRVV